MKNSKAKTLIILTPGFPADENDSTCLTHMQTFVRSLKQTNPTLQIVILALRYPFFSKSYMWHDVRVISFGGKFNGKWYRFLTNFSVWQALRTLNKEVEIVGLLSFWLNVCALHGAIFSKLYQLKHYCWLLGQDAKIGNKYVKLIRPSGAELIAVSDFISREFEKNYAIKPKHIIPIGIDDSLFSNTELARCIDVLGVGSLIPLKQYHLFLEVIKHLVLNFPNLKAVLCGDGIEMKMLRGKINDLKLGDNVSLVGEMPNKEILSLMQQTKVFLHTSNYEGFGAVNLEALCAGAKVVSFVKPMQSTIKNWYTVNDLPEMADKVKEILADESVIYEKVMPYTASANSKEFLALFGIEG
jgi:glycosyltransferase involved in cell wall biosynthesis